MTNFPPCPNCSEPDLYLRPLEDGFFLRCKECGWNSGPVAIASEPVTWSEAIAAVVAAAEGRKLRGTVDE